MGKLEADLTRLRNILDSITDRSIVILNELLSSTTLKDAVYIGTEILKTLNRIGTLCLYVTFIDEFASLPFSVSLLSLVDPSDPEIRTFKLGRRSPNGITYALTIAKKHGVLKENILERIRC
jgi:DNA mismatch repair ATPase MutS